MPVGERTLREALRFGIKTLILQEVRLLRLEGAFTPYMVTEDMSRSIQETKKEIVKLAKAIDHQKRTVLLKRMIRQTVDEEIDRAIQLRKNRCIRCLHMRFYDELETPHVNLPIGPLGANQAFTIGCDRLRPSLRKKCQRFVETSVAISLEDYLNEVTLLYEFRETFDRIEKIWNDYFLP